MNPLSSNRAVPRGRQRGAVTLVITMLILVAVALGMYSMVGTTSIESRMTANDKRGRQAMQAAQAGIDYLLAGLQGNALDRTYLCSNTTKATHSFVLDFGPTPCDEIPFEIITKLDKVRSWGYSPDGDAVRVIESTIDLTSAWNWGMSAASLPSSGGLAPVVTRNNVDFQGTPEVANCNLTGSAPLCSSLATPGNKSGIISGTLVRAGGSIVEGGNVPMGQENYAANDDTLANMGSEQLFQDFASGGMTQADFKTKAYTYGQTSGVPNAGNNQLIYVPGDLTFNNGELGSPTKPVILFVDGNLQLKGNVVIWGVVYTKSTDFSVGTNKIMGSLISEGAVNMKGNASVYYNADLRPNPTTIDPATLLANQTGKTTTVRVGSWRELTLPATAAPVTP